MLMPKLIGHQMTVITWFFTHIVKRKLVLQKILLLFLGKLICFFFQKEQQQQYTYIRFPRKKMELSSEYRHCHTGKKIGGSKTHVEQNTLNDLNLAAILLLVRVTMKFHLEKLDLQRMHTQLLQSILYSKLWCFEIYGLKSEEKVEKQVIEK